MEAWLLGLEQGPYSGRWFRVNFHVCPNPCCDCAEAALAFFELPPGSSQSGGLRAKCAVFYDYRCGGFKLIERESQSPKPAVLVDALRRVKPDLNSTLERRHQQLKQLARRLLPSSSRARPGYLNGTCGGQPRLTDAGFERRPVIAEEKPARNAPCPCGSGKKFKRCCGAA